ncbi:Uncharacterised protein [uncultured archaeon]|nr:Uncharacterised protein [uncultured archaeon]
MKVSELIKEFVPCEICGNKDLNNFYFYVILDKGPQAYVRCCECEEEYYSTRAGKILAQIGDSRKAKITFKNRPQETVHPLVKVLARI